MSGQSKLGFNATWSMAVGGMVGGGIFSTLGVVVVIAGAWAWLSFVAAGLVALAAGYSYVKLATHYGEGGGAFLFLREINRWGFAGSLSWVLIVGYVLTNAVYALTFGEYLGNVIGAGQWFPRVAAAAILAFFMGLNLRGVSEAGGVEVVLVWFKLAVLVVLAGWGLAQWDPAMLSRGVPGTGIGAALFGGASVFMAYEGFQLVTYDFDDIDNPQKTLPRAVLSAIVVVIAVYVVVALGVTTLIGADQVVAHQEVALAVAGRQAFGIAGLIVVSIGAAFSTGSAINATLFATARLTYEVAKDGELPAALHHRNRARPAGSGRDRTRRTSCRMCDARSPPHARRGREPHLPLHLRHRRRVGLSCAGRVTGPDRIRSRLRRCGVDRPCRALDRDRSGGARLPGSPRAHRRVRSPCPTSPHENRAPIDLSP